MRGWSAAIVDDLMRYDHPDYAGPGSMIPRILVIAGSDSGGGAGIQADIKTAMALGAYASTAITALTAQDTKTVSMRSIPVPQDFIRRQIEVALADPGRGCGQDGDVG